MRTIAWAAKIILFTLPIYSGLAWGIDCQAPPPNTNRDLSALQAREITVDEFTRRDKARPQLAEEWIQECPKPAMPAKEAQQQRTSALARKYHSADLLDLALQGFFMNPYGQIGKTIHVSVDPQSSQMEEMDVGIFRVYNQREPYWLVLKDLRPALHPILDVGPNRPISTPALIGIEQRLLFVVGTVVDIAKLESSNGPTRSYPVLSVQALCKYSQVIRMYGGVQLLYGHMFNIQCGESTGMIDPESPPQSTLPELESNPMPAVHETGQ